MIRRRSLRTKKLKSIIDEISEDDSFSRKSSKDIVFNKTKRKKIKLKEPFLTCRNILEDLMDQDDSPPFNQVINYFF